MFLLSIHYSVWVCMRHWLGLSHNLSWIARVYFYRSFLPREVDVDVSDKVYHYLRYTDIDTMIRLGVGRVHHNYFTKRAFTSHRYRLLGTRSMSSITTHPSLRKVSTESRYSSYAGATAIKIVLQMHPRR